MSELLNEKDLLALSEKGISQQALESQIKQFIDGFPYAKLEAPALLNDGLLDISDQKESLITNYDQAQLSCLKFVPASGAASRMFKKLFEFRSEIEKNNDASRKAMDDKGVIYDFFNQLSSFAFYGDLKMRFEELRGYSIQEAQNSEHFADILDVLLNEGGLNYGQLPKGLLKFHSYGSETKTPVEEHLTEGKRYANKNGEINIHFTVSPEHRAAFENHVQESINKQDGNFNITYSTQKPSTDTIAVDMKNQPFRMDDGTLLFRPAGHGALLENLNDLDADVIFIKNIDNVVPDRIKNETITYKKALAGLLHKYQNKAFDLLKKHDAGERIENEGKGLLEEMGCRGELNENEIVQRLNRPIRVCGMVKNEGEPGGGPFWLNEGGGVSSLQIVESAQVDMNDKGQVEIFKNSTHFNPVDLVCGVRNYKGEKFDLLKYRDTGTGFITEKSKEGRQLKAMELPGLWNGSMAFWNTIFVEVPLITFNPVKTVNDLLKENHC